MTVVTLFAQFYRNRSRADLLELVRTNFAVVAELPVLDLRPGNQDPAKRVRASCRCGDGKQDARAAHTGCCSGVRTACHRPRGAAPPPPPPPQVPLPVLQHIAQGLAAFRESAKQQLPTSWEARMRELLLEPATAQKILGLQVSLEESQCFVAETLVAGLKAAQALADLAAGKAPAGATAAATPGSGTAPEGGAGAGGASVPLPSPSAAVQAALAGIRLTGGSAGGPVIEVGAGLAAAGGGGASSSQGAAAAGGGAAGDGGKGAPDRPPKWIAVSGVDSGTLRRVVQGLMPDLDLRTVRPSVCLIPAWARAGTSRA